MEKNKNLQGARIKLQNCSHGERRERTLKLQTTKQEAFRGAKSKILEPYFVFVEYFVSVHL